MSTDSQTRSTIRFGEYEVDLRAGEVRRDGAKIRLQEQPFRVLQILLERSGEVVTREELQKQIWPEDTFVAFDTGLNNAVKRLREALGDSADAPHLIETLPRRGYRFIGKLRRSESVPAGIASLAVLPLENLSGDPEQEYFADGLTEVLITNLAKISALRVISRTTAMQYQGVRKSLPEIARELGVDAIVEGTVQRFAERVRISAQLIQASSDTHLWAESYERDLRDVLGLQAEVARAIASEIQVKLTPREQIQLTSAHRVDPAAYEFYLKGRYHLNRRSPEALFQGAKHFQKAIDSDPAYAAAYAGLSDSLTALGFWAVVPPHEGAAKGKAAALRAIELDGTIAEAHAALSFATIHYDFAPLAAERAARRAMELDPRNPLAIRALEISLLGLQRFDECVQLGRKAIELEPYSMPLRWLLGSVFYFSRQYDLALEELQNALDLDSSFAPAHFVISYCYLAKRMFAAGIKSAETAVKSSSGSPFFLSALGHAYASAGMVTDAQSVLSQLKDLSKVRYVSPYCFAWAMSPLDQMRHDALDALEAAQKERAPFFMWAKIGSWFDNLRSDHRFQQLLNRLPGP
ncbi:MAG TPA: winged helix-turn-helix domain-containing protein [Candidatus Acidoferrum sp.]|nr:winged helix-turn-helix domain-containing protein [Candidatus Acidoferrum sp.]